MLVHDVYFTLIDDSAEEQQKLVDACHHYLKDIPGIHFFAAGHRVDDLDRDVNDQSFHVGLHVVFEDRPAHDVYQTHEQHLAFIQESKPNWKQVRVFDTTAR